MSSRELNPLPSACKQEPFPRLLLQLLLLLLICLGTCRWNIWSNWTLLHPNIKLNRTRPWSIRTALFIILSLRWCRIIRPSRRASNFQLTRKKMMFVLLLLSIYFFSIYISFCLPHAAFSTLVVICMSEKKIETQVWKLTRQISTTLSSKWQKNLSISFSRQKWYVLFIYKYMYLYCDIFENCLHITFTAVSGMCQNIIEFLKMFECCFYVLEHYRRLFTNALSFTFIVVFLAYFAILSRVLSLLQYMYTHIATLSIFICHFQKFYINKQHFLTFLAYTVTLSIFIKGILMLCQLLSIFYCWFLAYICNIFQKFSTSFNVAPLDDNLSTFIAVYGI